MENLGNLSKNIKVSIIKMLLLFDITKEFGYAKILFLTITFDCTCNGRNK